MDDESLVYESEDRRRDYFQEQFRLKMYEIRLATEIHDEKERNLKKMYLGSRGFISKLKQFILDYSLVTTVQGFLYISEKRSIFEKIFWTVTVVISLIICVFMITEAYKKYENKAVIISFDTKSTPIYKIPFPAVTICPETQSEDKYFHVDKVDEMIRNKTELPIEMRRLYHYFFFLCDHNVYNLENGSKTFNEDFFTAVDRVKAPFKDLFFRCEIFGRHTDCAELFYPIFTDEGICYSFNMLSGQYLFKKDTYVPKNFFKTKPNKGYDALTGYHKDAGLYTYPRRALLSGTEAALRVTLKLNKYTYDYSCKSYFEGFRVVVHNPSVIPQASKKYFYVSMREFNSVAVKPQLLETEDRVRKLSVKKRKCYLENEKSLPHFKVYSQSNCMLECLTKFTKSICKCVSFFMPRNKNTPICGSGNYICVIEAEKKLKIKQKQTKNNYCDCKPLCNHVGFSLETSKNDWNWEEYYENQMDTEAIEERKKLNATTDEISLLSVYFKTSSIISLKRHELHGISDLIAKFGGFLSLFTGISFISIVEIVYFLSLRIWCNTRLYASWSGP